MNGFKEANVHELYTILRFVDIKSLYGDSLDVLLDWMTDGTYENSQYTAQEIIAYLQRMGDR